MAGTSERRATRPLPTLHLLLSRRARLPFGLLVLFGGLVMDGGSSAASGGARARSDAGASPDAAAAAVARSRAPVVEVLHGVQVVDRHRWLEDGAAPEVQAWTAAQNARTQELLRTFPGREALERRLWSLFEIGGLGPPRPRPLRATAGAGAQAWRYFYTRRKGTQNQPVLYVRDGLYGTDRTLIDVNQLASDGTRALDWWYPSEDGRLVVYGVSADGSEQSVLRVRDVASGQDLPDVISRTRACSVAWLPNGRGFFYTRYPHPERVPPGEESYHRHVFFHALGADPEADPLIFGAGRDLKDWPDVALSPNGRRLVIQVSQGWSRSELYWIDAASTLAPLLPPAPSRSRGVQRRAPSADAGPPPGDSSVPPFEPPRPIPLVAGQSALFDVVEVLDDALWVRTNLDAPRYRLVRIPLHAGLDQRSPRGPGADWRTVLAQSAHTLEHVVLLKTHFAALFLEDGVSRVRLFTRRGAPAGDLRLPGIGRVPELHGHHEGTELFLPFVSFLTPTSVLRLDVASSVASTDRRMRQSRTSSNHTPTVWQALAHPLAEDDFVVETERVRSRDGTELPLFLIRRRDLPRDGDRPTVLYGYGGFNVNVTPTWSPSILPFVERGGIYAVAVLRGGGEYGEDWHRAGMLGSKQNVFDDFIAAAEHLIATKRTRPARLAISGRSNGGLLVGAVLTQRPELFRAALSGVPLLDMVRYHRFRIAQLWIPEYGSSDDPEAFRWLYAYSPYHRVRDGVAYPAVLLSTAESDTRVDPLHARKMAARLQEASASKLPVLLRIESHAGHGAGKPLAKTIAQLVDEWSFLFLQLGIDMRSGVP